MKTANKYNLGKREINHNYTARFPDGSVEKILLFPTPHPYLRGWNVSHLKFKKGIPEETSFILMPPRDALAKYCEESLKLFRSIPGNEEIYQKFINGEISLEDVGKKEEKISTNVNNYSNSETKLEKAVRTLALSRDKSKITESKKYLADFFLGLHSKKGKSGDASMLMGNSDESPKEYIQEVIDYLVEGHRTSQYEREESLRRLRDLENKFKRGVLWGCLTNFVVSKKLQLKNKRYKKGK